MFSHIQECQWRFSYDHNEICVCVWCVQGSGCCGPSSSCSAAAVRTDTVEPNSESSSNRDRERSACWPTMEPTPTPPLCWTSVRNLNLCFLDAFSGYLKNEVFRLGLFFFYPYLITAGLKREPATTRLIKTGQKVKDKMLQTSSFSGWLEKKKASFWSSEHCYKTTEAGKP